MNSTSSFSDASALVTSFGSIVITVIGLVFNTFTVFVILKSSKLKSNCIAPLICGLTFSDITFCFSLILVSIQFYQNEAFSEGSFLCFFSPIFYRYIAKIEYSLMLLPDLIFLIRCSFLSSGVFSTLISVQRVILIESLNQNIQAFTWKKTFGYFCLVWTILILFHLLQALRVWGQIGVKDGLPYCTVWNEGESDYIDKLIHMFGYLLPFISLIACYIFIHKSIKAIESTTGREYHVTQTSCIVIGSYRFFCLHSWIYCLHV